MVQYHLGVAVSFFVSMNTLGYGTKNGLMNTEFSKQSRHDMIFATKVYSNLRAVLRTNWLPAMNCLTSTRPRVYTKLLCAPLNVLLT